MGNTESNGALCPRCTKAKDEVGETVYCAVCEKAKSPSGRSCPMGLDLCDHDCGGYYQEPHPTSLWSGETRLDFGYGGAMAEPCTCVDLMADRVKDLGPEDLRKLTSIAEEYQDDCCENDSTYLLQLFAYAYYLGGRKAIS